MSPLSVKVAVVGGGPVGLTAAIALAGAGVATALIAKPARAPDNRTTALVQTSIAALEVLGVWPGCLHDAAPLRAMRIIDDTTRLLRVPQVQFDASEIGLDAFGCNIENRFLLAALASRARELSSLRLVEAEAQAVAIGDSGVTVRLEDGTSVEALLAIGADGARSLCRQAAGIASTGHSYPQTALTLNLSHSRQHQGITTEFHTAQGPFTLVPLPGLRSSLVLVTDREEASRLAKLGDAEFSSAIERRSHSILGKIAIEPGRGVFELAVQTAQRLAFRRVALTGEAAHLIPPIGAQGLNLGLRDAAVIAELTVAAHRGGRDVGGAEVTDRYDSMRRADVMTRTLAVDLLNRSLLSDFLPLQGARGLGLYLTERIGPLRRAMMREGVAPVAARPRLMRGEAL